MHNWRAKVPVVLVVLLICLGSAQIVSTYKVFSQTFDEPFHLAAGMEWLDCGSYTYDVIHTPLARIAVAIGPFLDGLRSMHYGNYGTESIELLYARGQYLRNLSLARLGTLPFFLIAAVFVWLWARMLFGTSSALFATALFTTLPPILAHSGLATTDMAITATFIASLTCCTWWLERPTFVRSILFGSLCGLAVLSKLTALVILPLGITAILAVRRQVKKRNNRPEATSIRRSRLFSTGVCMLTALLIIWAGYRFSVGPVHSASEGRHETIDYLVGESGPAHDLACALAEMPGVPAPEFFQGIDTLLVMNSFGHASYVLGKRLSGDGAWYFFPVALLFKTPLPFLMLTAVGLSVLCRRAWRKGGALRGLEPAVCAACLLLTVIPSNVNIGLRHILPIYPLLAIVAGFGACTLWELDRFRVAARIATAALVISQFASTLAAHPDYLAYFNVLAGSHPEKILVDSDLDWGQDLHRLSKELRARGVEEINIAYFGSADISRHNLPTARNLLPNQRATGWIAISLMVLKTEDGYSWLESYTPVALVGRSILLYHVEGLQQ